MGQAGMDHKWGQITRNGSAIDHKLDQYQKWVKNGSEMGADYKIGSEIFNQNTLANLAY